MPGCTRQSREIKKQRRRVLTLTRGAARIVGVATLVGLLSAGAAQGAFTGTCSIVVAAPGVVTTNPSLTTLSTKNPGGLPAHVSVTANAGGVLPGLICSLGLPLNCMKVTVTAPASFNSAPAAGGSNVTFDSTLSVVGSGSEINLLGLVILNGTTLFDFDLVATKLSGTFAAGNYSATEIVRCE